MKFVNTILLSALSLGVVAQEPKNVIMVVGDGMGPAYTTAYRYFADDKNTLDVEQTVFDRMLVGMASTYPARISGYVTDSAAGATALATGVKSYNGAIAVNVDKKPVSTVLEWAKEQGMKTGVAVTSQINHATPAGYSAHNESRKNYDQIADSYFDEKINDHFVLDVMLGGGWDYFIRDDRNLVAEFKKAGYQYVDNIAHLKTANSKQPLLGLFAEQGLNWALDMPPKQRLKTLTQAAVEHLENDQGFFLLVEASQIDWAGHSNDVGAAMSEMQDLAQTMTWLEQYVDAHPDTLLVLTADHSTGGFTIGANKIYRWEPQWLDNLQASPYAIAKQLMSAEKKSALAAELLGFSLNEEEKSKIEAIDTQDEEIAYQTVKTLLDVRTNTGWTTGGHTGVDVPVFAKGPGSEMFRGMLNNTQVADNIFSLLGRK
ncbi:alkaline phosphatase [Paraglaciecola chathamensis]|uniref:Alkaline phosphatase 3 n=1 Tax=Paraglaciecola chathamensis S18K6 TaxID=1127672 RepID=A0AAV3UXN2_9ALTE|nr:MULTISPECIES: alkaline phosphatase [Paraglaciecola]MBN25311.1 alkaline phosphatase [Alteromonadaceae bacterium]GAC10779.1 alkaline phosphatase 3 [Paraglaciecola chathamensis S18K6]|tara:strand:+ start:61691 stop:62980 length:1290 start_codon:yes stop_codon:yes gene_type:complete